MENSIWIAIVFGAILILGGLFGRLTSGLRSVALILGAGIIVIGIVGPDSLKSFKAGKDGIELTRHQPSDNEREITFKLAQDKPSPEILREGQKFIKEAKNRIPEERSPEDYLALATEKWRAKNYDKALADVFAGLALNPKNTRTKASLIHRKGSIYNNLGLEEVIKSYNEAIDLDPRFSWPHYNLGRLYQNQSKLVEAEAEYKKAIELDPKYSPAHYNLGLLYQYQGKLVEAEAKYNKAIELNPKNSSAHNNLGLLHENQGKLVEAEAEYKKAIELDPKNSVAHNNLGIIYKKQGKLDEAKSKAVTPPSPQFDKPGE